MTTRLRGSVFAGLFLAGFFVFATAEAQSPQPAGDLSERIEQLAGLENGKGDLALRALGIAVREQLAQGREVSLDGLGTFRIVRLPAYPVIVAGREVRIPAENVVEFIPEGALAGAANDSGVRPSVIAEPYSFNPFPSHRAEEKDAAPRRVDGMISPGRKTRTQRVP